MSIKINTRKLLSLVSSFLIDPLVGVTLDKRSNSTWALCLWNQCLNKKTGEFEFESLPSERSKSFLADTRFSSIEEAVEFYAQWRKKRSFIFARSNGDQRWNHFASSLDYTEVHNFWKNLAEPKPGKRERYGLWILMGEDSKIIEEYRHPETDTKIQFEDKFMELV